MKRRQKFKNWERQTALGKKSAVHKLEIRKKSQTPEKQSINSCQLQIGLTIFSPRLFN